LLDVRRNVRVSGGALDGRRPDRLGPSFRSLVPNPKEL